ncbi:MAG: hypothetical protein M1495_08560 [Bacteroidetes bacterium]|nr:hypothetical protein [Bacteroidota bacterium]
MKFITVIFLSSVLFLQLVSCKDTGTGPNQKPFKDPRDMTWTADTVFNPNESIQTTMTTMYASSSSNVYLAGHNDGRDQIWHYDGKTWISIDLISQIGGYTVVGVHGISEKSIWVYGFRGYGFVGQEYKRFFVLENNGGAWQPHDLDGYGAILSVGGNDERNLWACGDSGFVFNYNGSTWKKDRINIPFLKGAFYTLVSTTVYKNQTYALASIFDPQRSRELYYYVYGNINNWTIADSIVMDNPFSVIKWGYLGLYSSPFEKLYSYGPGGIWEWQNGWINILKLNFPIRGMYGISSDYIFAAGDYGYVYFYDGTSWIQLTKFAETPSYLVYTDAWTNGYETFILGHTVNGWPQKTVIWRGK